MKDMKAVIFDFDGTLGIRAHYAKKELADYVAECFPNLDRSSLEFEAKVQHLLDYDACGNNQKELVAFGFKKRYPHDKDPDQFSQWWLDHMEKYIELYPDAIETLDYLKENYRLAIITNGDSPTQHWKVKTSGIEDYFEVCIASNDIGIHKPDPGIFQYVADRLNLDVSECVYVGDTFQYDVYGALNAGMKAIWMKPDKDRYSDYPVTRIYALSELKDIL